MKLLIGYLVLINVLAFALMGIDKRRARQGAWRIPEKMLFLSAIVGGSIGAIVGMRLFRHKTQHRQFIVGMPAILAIQLMIAYELFLQFHK